VLFFIFSLYIVVLLFYNFFFCVFLNNNASAAATTNLNNYYKICRVYDLTFILTSELKKRRIFTLKVYFFFFYFSTNYLMRFVLVSTDNILVCR